MYSLLKKTDVIYSSLKTIWVPATLYVRIFVCLLLTMQTEKTILLICKAL